MTDRGQSIAETVDDHIKSANHTTSGPGVCFPSPALRQALRRSWPRRRTVVERLKFGHRPFLPIELAQEGVDLTASRKGEFRDMLLKQPLIRVRPTRRATAELPAFGMISDRQPCGARRNLTLDDAEMALRLGLRRLHACEHTPIPGLNHRTVPKGHDGKGESSGA